MYTKLEYSSPTVIAATVTENHIVLMEKGHPDWEGALSGAFGEITPYFAPVKDVDLEIRTQRDALLSASDWTQVADAPVDQAAWAAYRQALRDVPAQAGFPTDVVWPEQPL